MCDKCYSQLAEEPAGGEGGLCGGGVKEEEHCVVARVKGAGEGCSEEGRSSVLWRQWSVLSMGPLRSAGIPLSIVVKDYGWPAYFSTLVSGIHELG